jgi:hypothetical protein
MPACALHGRSNTPTGGRDINRTGQVSVVAAAAVNEARRRANLCRSRPVVRTRRGQVAPLAGGLGSLTGMRCAMHVRKLFAGVRHEHSSEIRFQRRVHGDLSIPHLDRRPLHLPLRSSRQGGSGRRQRDHAAELLLCARPGGAAFRRRAGGTNARRTVPSGTGRASGMM